MELEAPIVHLPMKRLKFLYTTTTLAIEKDIQAVIAKVQYLKANASNLNPTEASEMLLVLITRLESLQRKVRFLMWLWFHCIKLELPITHSSQF